MKKKDTSEGENQVTGANAATQNAITFWGGGKTLTDSKRRKNPKRNKPYHTKKKKRRRGKEEIDRLGSGVGKSPNVSERQPKGKKKTGEGLYLSGKH